MRYIFSLALISFLCTACNIGDTDPYVKEVMAHRYSLDSLFKNGKKESPLPAEDQRLFVKLNYFKPDSNFRFNARVEILEKPQVVLIERSSQEDEEFYKIAYLHFKINGKDHKLAGFKNMEMMDYDHEHRNTLFVPFYDLTNGDGTYRGGRFMDIEYNGEDNITLDFNYAYNPYCAYGENYSCPLPPAENDLPVRIEAGEKIYATH